MRKPTSVPSGKSCERLPRSRRAAGRRAGAAGVVGTRSRPRATDSAAPGGAQPQRGSARVPRGPAIPAAPARRPRRRALACARHDFEDGTLGGRRPLAPQREEERDGDGSEEDPDGTERGDAAEDAEEAEQERHADGAPQEPRANDVVDHADRDHTPRQQQPAGRQSAVEQEPDARGDVDERRAGGREREERGEGAEEHGRARARTSGSASPGPNQGSSPRAAENRAGRGRAESRKSANVRPASAARASDRSPAGITTRRTTSVVMSAAASQARPPRPRRTRS